MRKIRCSVYSPKNMKKLFCQLKKKDRCCFWEKECHTVAQAGDGESDVLRAGPGWPLRPPCESALPRGRVGSWPGLVPMELQLRCPITLSGLWENAFPCGHCQPWPIWAVADVVVADPSFFCKLHLLLAETLSLPAQPDHTLLQLTQKFLLYCSSPGICW